MEVTGGNERLRDLLKEAGLTHDATARAVNRVAAENGALLRSNKSSITHWLGGTRPQPDTIVFLAEAIARRVGRRIQPADLGYGDIGQYDLTELPADPISALARLGRADMDRREVLTSAAYSLGALLLPIEQLREHSERTDAAITGRSIGQAEVDVVKQVIATFDFADERLGGGFGRRALVEYLTTDIAAYCQANGPQVTREAMYSAAMQLAYLAGWKSHDLMQEGLAQRYYLFAFDLAMMSDDKRQAAYVMRILAHQAFDLGHYANCLDLAETSTRLIRGQADPHTEALFTMTLARAHAMRGEKRQALETINEAEKIHERSSPGDTRPTWVKLRHNYGQF
ncbi:MAG TPA: hypothetical protein DGG94_07445, partial [Micromonosporaceae bacterium]|nr:hypothetical protein [Micromonosporaceae bacterium]